MPSPNIVRDIRTAIQNKLLPTMPKKWQPQLQLGLKAYGLQAFQSATGNARRAATGTANAAARQSERLLANWKLANQLGTTFDSLRLVRPGSYVAVDHSDMNGLMALVGAVQTRNGRAIPCMVEATYSERLSARDDAMPRKRALRAASTKAWQWQCLTGHVIDSLQDLHDRLGFWPKLVFDRGFANYSLVTHLAAEGATFYVRLKSGRYVELDGRRTEVKQLEEKDTTVQLFGLQLRVVRSAQNRRCKQPWYILTNDFSSSRNKVVKIYYHRFEIEEAFKDIKHVFEFRRTRLNNPNSLKVVLWLICLGIALLYVVTRPTKQAIQSGNRKKRCSWIRLALEQLHQAFGLVLWGGV